MLSDNIETIKKDWLDFSAFKEKYLKEEVAEFPNKVLEEMPEPLVSVMIITFQHVDYIREAIESVLMQKTDFPFEVIIGDDASTDGTAEICKEYAENYPRKIRLFQHKKENNVKIGGKPSHLFQFMYNLFHFRGKYAAIISGDDYWTDPIKLQKQFNFMESNSNISYCYHGWKYFFENSKKFSIEYETDLVQTFFAINVFDRLPKNYINCINEDEYMKFILKTYGDSAKVDDIEPSIYRMTGTNNWGIGETLSKCDHKVNTFKNILSDYRDTRFEKVSQKLLFTMIMKKYHFLFAKNKIKFILPMLRELGENKLLSTFLFRQVVKNLPFVKS